MTCGVNVLQLQIIEIVQASLSSLTALFNLIRASLLTCNVNIPSIIKFSRTQCLSWSSSSIVIYFHALLIVFSLHQIKRKSRNHFPLRGRKPCSLISKMHDKIRFKSYKPRKMCISLRGEKRKHKRIDMKRELCWSQRVRIATFWKWNNFW